MLRCIQPFLGAFLVLLCAACLAPRTDELSGSVVPDPAVDLANAKTGNAAIYREGYLGEGDDRIHYVEAGSGPTVLFVHGFPAFWYVWFDQMEALRSCRRVIAIDAPGANLSARPASTEYYRIGNLANRLDSVIAALAPGEAITLVGHDWGGALAWSYAEHNSSRVKRLAIFSAPPHDLMIEMLATDPEQRARSAYMERFATLSLDDISEQGIHLKMFEIGYRGMIDRGILDPEEGELFRRVIADPVAINAGMDWYRANVPRFDTIDPRVHSWPAHGASTGVPTLLVRGELDRTFVPAMGERAQAHASQLSVSTIPSVAHWTQFENPQAAAHLLADFVGAPAGCRSFNQPAAR